MVAKVAPRHIIFTIMSRIDATEPWHKARALRGEKFGDRRDVPSASRFSKPGRVPSSPSSVSGRPRGLEKIVKMVAGARFSNWQTQTARGQASPLVGFDVRNRADPRPAQDTVKSIPSEFCFEL